MPSLKTIAIVTDDNDLACLLQQGCASLGLLVRCYPTIGSSLIANVDAPPDVMVIDANADCGGGMTVLGLLIGYDQFASAPAILLADQADRDLVRRCHSMFAYHVVKSDSLFDQIKPLLYELVDIEPPRPHNFDRRRFAPTQGTAEPNFSESLPSESMFADTSGATKQRPAAQVALSAPTSQMTIQEAIEFVSSQPALTGDQAPSAPKPASESVAPPRLLWILDHRFESVELKELLESYGVAVIRAQNAEEGVRMALAQPVTALLIDLPESSSEVRYLMGRLRNNPITRALPVVVRGDDLDRAMQRTLLHWGASEIICREAGDSELVETLREHIDLLPVAQASRYASLV